MGVQQSEWAAVQALRAGDIDWYNVQEWGVEGKGWSDTERFYDRLPARAAGQVRPEVWNLAHDSAGMLTRFVTDSPVLRARWRLLKPELDMADMAATAVSGVDLYAWDGSSTAGSDRCHADQRQGDGQDKRQGQWRWIGTGQPDSFPLLDKELVTQLDPGRRLYQLNLPLYNGVESVEIGVKAGSFFAGVRPRASKPIVFYGTSIVQGAVASRPGMCHVALLGRRLDQPVINLGFSGNALMEPEVADLVAELDAAVFVIDCLPNTTGPIVAERAEPLLRKIRTAHAFTPIVLVEDRTMPVACFQADKRAFHAANRGALRDTYRRLLADGFTGLLYVTGEQMLGDDSEATVDGSHPTDVGFMRMVGIFEPLLRSLLPQI